MDRFQKMPLLVILWLDLFLSLATLILETKTGSIVMLFSVSGPNDIRPAYFDYFELTPFGYGNIFPFFVFVFSVLLTLFSLFRLVPAMRRIFKIEHFILRLSILFNLLPYLIFWGGYRISIGVILVEILLILKHRIALYYANEF